MKNKKWYLPMLLLAMTMGYSSLKACHEGDFGALNKGHYKWGKNVRKPLVLLRLLSKALRK